MTDHFDRLQQEKQKLVTVSEGLGPNAYFTQESLRFISMAGTMKSMNFTLDATAKVDERHITHVLTRSLLENYFWLLYIFDDDTQKQKRYDELLNSFKLEYSKLLKEPELPHKDQLEPEDQSWAMVPRGLDVKSMLAQIKNDHGQRLDYLYFVYRISSFDTHGKNLGTIGRSCFRKVVNFPVLQLNEVFDLIANHYLVILAKLEANGEV